MKEATMNLKEMKKAYTKVFKNIENVDIALVKELIENVNIKSANKDGKITSVATMEWLESAKEALVELLSQLEPTETESESDFENVSLGKLATCVCGCGATLPSGAMLEVEVANRGGRVGFVCPDCADVVLDKYTENTVTVGSGDTWIFENEIECINPSANIRACLMSANYIPTECNAIGDNGVKFVSPTYYGFKSFHKLSETIQHLLDSGDIEIDINCQANIKIGHVSYDFYCMSEYHSEIFKPLYEAMADNESMALALFGMKTKVYYGEKLDFSARYVNRKQYDLVVKCCKEMVSAIVNNYIKNYTGESKNDSHKAKIAGGKLVKLFNKFGKMAIELQECQEIKECMC